MKEYNFTFDEAVKDIIRSAYSVEDAAIANLKKRGILYEILDC